MSIVDLLTTETITVPQSLGGEMWTIKITAHVYGLWAVHKKLHRDNEWTVTHLPSGMALPRDFLNIEEACGALEYISSLANDFDRLATDTEFWKEIGIKFRERYECKDDPNTPPESYEHARLNTEIVDRVLS